MTISQAVYEGQIMMIADLQSQLAETQRELDVLRKDLYTLKKNSAQSNNALHREALEFKTERDAEKARAERLEAAIQDAPHDEDCRDNAWHMENCTCWKREALEGK